MFLVSPGETLPSSPSVSVLSPARLVHPPSDTTTYLNERVELRCGAKVRD